MPKGISREPQIQSKKRTPLNPPQVSTSLQWGDPGVLIRRQITTLPASPPAVVSVAPTSSVENAETPLAPRTSKPARASKMTPVQEECASGHISRASADQETEKQPADGVSTIHSCSLAETGEIIIFSICLQQCFINTTYTNWNWDYVLSWSGLWWSHRTLELGGSNAPCCTILLVCVNLEMFGMLVHRLTMYWGRRQAWSQSARGMAARALSIRGNFSGKLQQPNHLFLLPKRYLVRLTQHIRVHLLWVL